MLPAVFRKWVDPASRRFARFSRLFSPRAVHARLALLLTLAALTPAISLAQRSDLPFRQTATVSAGQLTTDGDWRLEGWSPDGTLLLVSRWGDAVPSGDSQQALNELWRLESATGARSLVSPNAAQPAFSPDGQHLAFLSFEEGSWRANSFDLSSAMQLSLGVADWRVSPGWVQDEVVFHSGAELVQARTPDVVSRSPLDQLPSDKVIALSDGADRAAWIDDRGLWIEEQAGEPRQIMSITDTLSATWSPDGSLLAILSGDSFEQNISIVDLATEQSRLVLTLRDEMISSLDWHPSGAALALSKAGRGSAMDLASDIFYLDLQTDSLTPLIVGAGQQDTPRWSPDGLRLAYVDSGDIWVVNYSDGVVRAIETPPANVTELQSDEQSISATASEPTVTTTAQQIPQDIIRVLHLEANHLRSTVPVGQIDHIPMEDYVKLVLVIEVSASWPAESLRAQAVAVRTYGWYSILHPRYTSYDVNDWYDQVMGRYDQLKAETNAAVDHTWGQYIAYQGGVIKSFYSANNSSPTRDMDGVGYIVAIDDPVGFGETRYGHGWGMSQWGAHDWAKYYGWTYQQILTHYYFGTTVELPSAAGPAPLGGVILPWRNHYVTSGQVAIIANATDSVSQVAKVEFFVNGALLATDTNGADGWSTLWSVAATPGTNSASTHKLAARVTDIDGNQFHDYHGALIGIDHQPPTAVSGKVGSPFTKSPFVTIVNLAASDPVPGSGTSTVSFSNENWRWSGEGLPRNTGVTVNDQWALDGKAWLGRQGVDQGVVYGPYTRVLPAGAQYRALFRLKTNANLNSNYIARLDVVSEGGKEVLGVRHLRGTDFRGFGVYEEFSIDFDYRQETTTGLEFRLHFYGNSNLWFDRVIVASYPKSMASSYPWQINAVDGIHRVTIKYFDRAGNVSADRTSNTVLDRTPPGQWRNYRWSLQSGSATASIQVRDSLAGLASNWIKYRVVYTGGQWQAWQFATVSGPPGSTTLETVTAAGIPLDAAGRPPSFIEFRAVDRAVNYAWTVRRVGAAPVAFFPTVFR